MGTPPPPWTACSGPSQEAWPPSPWRNSFFVFFLVFLLFGRISPCTALRSLSCPVALISALEEISHISYSCHSFVPHCTGCRSKHEARGCSSTHLLSLGASCMLGVARWFSKTNITSLGFWLIALFLSTIPVGQILDVLFNSLLVCFCCEKYCSAESRGKEICLITELGPTLGTYVTDNVIPSGHICCGHLSS